MCLVALHRYMLLIFKQRFITSVANHHAPIELNTSLNGQSRKGGFTGYVQHTEQGGRGVQEMRREVEELQQCQQDIRQLHLIMSRQSRKFWDLAKARAQGFGESRH